MPNSQTPTFTNSAKKIDATLFEYWGNYGYGPWYMDSGAFANIASHSHKVDIIEPSSSNVRIQKVKIGGGESHPICGTSNPL